MAVITTKQFSKDEIRHYAITDFAKFKEQANVRLLALGASALLYWIDLVKGRFSASTSARYLESLYWDTGNPKRIVLGVIPGTLADLLEYGQHSHPLNAIFLQGGKASKVTKRRPGGSPYRRIPMTKDPTYLGTTKPPQLTQGGVQEIIEKRKPRTAAFIIKSKLSNFTKTSAKSHSYREHASFVRSEHTEFRTITPAKTWTHPGIRAALLGHQVSSWVALQRESFVAPILGGNAGIILPDGYSP
jgi:hypothetical protein